MEALKTKRLSYSQKKARLSFATEYVDFDWNKVVFMGLNKIGTFEMWGVISQWGDYPLRMVCGRLISIAEYESYLDNTILQWWNAKKDLIFMQDEQQSFLSRHWRAIHTEMTFVNWPNELKDQNPFNEVWGNVNNRVEVGNEDIPTIYRSWIDASEDFGLIFTGINNLLQEVVENNGDYTN